MPASTQANFYLLTTLEFNVGSQHVKLYGAIQIATGSKDLYLVLADKTNLPQLLPADATPSISQPFGMTGVELSTFSANAHIYQQDQTLEIDFTLMAVVTFPDPKHPNSNLSKIQLTGAIGFEKSTPRLAYVALDASKPLTLTDFVQSVIGGGWSWADDMTNQLAFQNGHMYYLYGSDNYTFPYTDASGQSQSIVCTRGYHVSTTIILFQDEKYTFEIELDVVPDDNNQNAIDLKTTVKKTLGLGSGSDFGDTPLVQLNDLSLDISTRQKNTYFQISGSLVILGTSFDVLAAYSNSTFTGTITVDGISLSLSFSNSIITGTVTYDPLTIVFQWARGDGPDSGFSIVEIRGIPQVFLDALKIYNYFKQLGGDNCQELVQKWFDNMVKGTLTVSLDKSQKPSGSFGSVFIPVLIDYEIDFDGNRIAQAQIPFTVRIDVPKSLHELPGKIVDFLENSPDILAQILSNPDTYKAIAMAIAVKAGGKALASFICKAQENGDPDTAEDLASPENVAAVPMTALSDAVALAGIVVAVSLLGMRALRDLFDEILNLIKKLLPFLSKSGEAEDKIQDMEDRVNGTLKPINDKIDAIKTEIKIVRLMTDINNQSRFEAQIVPASGFQLEPGSSISYSFDFLPGAAGDVNDKALTSEDPAVFPLVRDWSSIPQHWSYQLNARAQSILKGYSFMTDSDRQNIVDAINSLNDPPSGVNNSRDFAASLQKTLDTFDQYEKDGIPSDWVYARSDTPTRMTVGKSRIGINTRI